MANGTKIVLDKAGIKELLRSNEILGSLMNAGEKVANSAGATYEAREHMRPSRAVCNVVDTREGAMHIEAATGNLARAIGNS